MKTLILTLALLAGAVSAQAQNVTDSVSKSTPFTLAADVDIALVDHFNLYLDGVVIQVKPASNIIPGSTDPAGNVVPPTIEFVFPMGLAAVGVHVFFAEAVGGSGQADQSNTLTLTVLETRPGRPRNLHKK